MRRTAGNVKAAIEEEGEWVEVGSRTELIGRAELPAGRIWNATDCHIIAMHFLSDRPAGWRALGRDVEQGTRACDQSNCDVCLDAAKDAIDAAILARGPREIRTVTGKVGPKLADRIADKHVGGMRINGEDA